MINHQSLSHYWQVKMMVIHHCPLWFQISSVETAQRSSQRRTALSSCELFPSAELSWHVCGSVYREKISRRERVRARNIPWDYIVVNNLGTYTRCALFRTN